MIVFSADGKGHRVHGGVGGIGEKTLLESRQDQKEKEKHLAALCPAFSLCNTSNIS